MSFLARHGQVSREERQPQQAVSDAWCVEEVGCVCEEREEGGEGVVRRPEHEDSEERARAEEELPRSAQLREPRSEDQGPVLVVQGLVIFLC